MRSATNSIVLFITLTLILLPSAPFALAQSDAPAARAKPPAPDDVKKLTESVRIAYASLYADKAPNARNRLARKLMEEATTIAGDTGGRYAMLLEARRVAAEIGDVEAAAMAIYMIEAYFDTDIFAMRVDLADTLSKQLFSLTPDAAAALCEMTCALIEDSLEEEDAGVTARLLTLAENSSKRIKDPARLAALKTRVRDLQEISNLYRKADALKSKLLEDPNHTEALALVGRYYCFIKKSFDKGAPLLARSADAQVKAAAGIELKADRQPTDWAIAGDAWLAAARAEKVAVFRTGMARRAIYWYEQAVQQLTGLQKAAAEQAMLEAYKTVGLPAGYAKLSEQERERLVRNGNKWFLVVKLAKTWTAAAKWCEERHGALASVESPAENEFLWRHCLKRYQGHTGLRLWLNGSDKAKEGDWRWRDGSPIKYRNWAPGQPDNERGNEHYLIIWGSVRGGSWNDAPEVGPYHFIAEWKVK